MGHKSKRNNRTGYVRPGTVMGKMRDHNEIVNPLPPVGSYVVVRECAIHVTKNKDTELYTTYEYHPQFRDVWNRPKVLKVIGYTKGIERALDPANRILLEWTASSGVTFHHELQVIQVSTGSIYLTVVEA